MPKAILEFNLPEEQGEYETTLNAHKYRGVIQDLLNEIRASYKYDAKFNDRPLDRVTLEDVKDRIITLLNESDILI